MKIVNILVYCVPFTVYGMGVENMGGLERLSCPQLRSFLKPLIEKVKKEVLDESFNIHENGAVESGLQMRGWQNNLWHYKQNKLWARFVCNHRDKRIDNDIALINNLYKLLESRDCSIRQGDFHLKKREVAMLVHEKKKCDYTCSWVRVVVRATEVLDYLHLVQDPHS